MKETRLQIRVTDREKDILEQEAQRRGLTVSALIVSEMYKLLPALGKKV